MSFDPTTYAMCKNLCGESGLPVVEVGFINYTDFGENAGMTTEDVEKIKTALLNGVPFILKATYNVWDSEAGEASEDMFTMSQIVNFMSAGEGMKLATVRLAQYGQDGTIDFLNIFLATDGGKLFITTYA